MLSLIEWVKKITGLLWLENILKDIKNDTRRIRNTLEVHTEALRVLNSALASTNTKTKDLHKAMDVLSGDEGTTSIEGELPQRTLDSETCMAMMKVGLNPLIEKHYNKYLAWLGCPEEVQLVEGEDWEFKLNDEQLTELGSLLDELGPVSDGVKIQFINYKIQEYLPEVKLLPTDELTRELMDRIINDPPLYFQHNKSFVEKINEWKNKDRIE